MARLDLYRDGKWKSVLVLGERTYLVGREPSCDMVISDELASRRHFRLVHRGPGQYALEDMDTPNGTMVNGVREFNRVLRSQATLQVGGEMMVFDPDGQGDTPPEDEDLPEWALDAFGDDGDSDMPSTAHIAPAELNKLQAKVRARTRPHLLVMLDRAATVFPLDTKVTNVGYGHVRASLGAAVKNKDRVLAEVVGDATSGFRIKAKGLFGKVSVNGKAKKEHTLKEGDRVLLDGHTLTFSMGLDEKRD
jgi:hypothetical protein